MLDWSGQLDELNAARAKEDSLRNAFLDKKRQAINLEAYRKQLADIEQSFGAMLKQLPNRSEMEALLSDINQAGLGRGLQFELFKPASARDHVRLLRRAADPDQGHRQLSRHRRLRERRLAAVAHRHAEQPRACGLDKDGTLMMDATARTFRYLDEEEIAAQRKGGARKGRKGQAR